MNCPDTGQLRAWIDGVNGRPPDLGGHLADCRGCTNSLNELRETSQLAERAMTLLEPRSLPTSGAIELSLRRLREQTKTAPRATEQKIASMPTLGISASSDHRTTSTSRFSAGIRRWRLLV